MPRRRPRRHQAQRLDRPEPAKGRSGFLGALKQVIHAGLLELGTLNLVRHGKQLGAAALEKGTSAAKWLAARLFGPKMRFKAGREDHELWVEERRSDAVVLVATEETELEAKLTSFDSAIAAMPDSGPQKQTAVADVGRLRASYRALKESWAAARASIPAEPLAPGVAVRSKRDITAVERNVARRKQQIVDELKRLLLLHAPGVGDFVLDLDTTGLSGQAKKAAGGALSLNYMVGRIHAVERATGWRPVSAGITRGGDEELVTLGSEYGLRQYVRYHIHGPGLGQEHYPIPLAPTRANQFANSDVEGFMRRRRDAGAAVEFNVTYVTYGGAELRPFIESMLRSGDKDIITRLALDQGLIEKFLKTATYDIRVTENGVSNFHRADITMNPPVMRQSTSVTTGAPRLTRRAPAHA